MQPCAAPRKRLPQLTFQGPLRASNAAGRARRLLLICCSAAGRTSPASTQGRRRGCCAARAHLAVVDSRAARLPGTSRRGQIPAASSCSNAILIRARGDGGLAALQGQRLQRPIVDLGDEDPLYTRNISNGPPDRRRVSLRWLAGSVLTGIFSVGARRRRAAGGDRPRRIYRGAPGARPRQRLWRRRRRREGRPLPPGAGEQGLAPRHPDLHGDARERPQHRARAPLRACPHASLAAPVAPEDIASRIPRLPGRRHLHRRRGGPADGGHLGEQFHLRRGGRRRGRDQDRRTSRCPAPIYDESAAAGSR